MELLRHFWDEAIALDPALAERDEAHLPLSRRGELDALWAREGLTAIAETQLTIELRFASFEDLLAPFLLGQGPAGAYVKSLPAERRALLERRLRARILGDGPDRPIVLAGRAWAVRGTVQRPS